MQRTRPLAALIAQDCEIDQTVIPITKACLGVIAALIDMQRDARHDEPLVSPHGG
jgi:hypothetical protein